MTIRINRLARKWTGGCAYLFRLRIPRRLILSLFSPAQGANVAVPERASADCEEPFEQSLEKHGLFDQAFPLQGMYGNLLQE